MSSVYTATAGSLAAAVNITIPADGDALVAASADGAFQKLADYLEAFRLGTGTFAEGFEAATFPPTATGKWTAPSSRFGSDTAWVRTTTNPIAGTASASAPVPQTLSTNSSLGLDVVLTSPARLSFLFALNCNNNNGDHLDFYVDGVLTGQLSTITSNTLIGSMIKTDLLREGPHTFDWRLVRGGSASVGSEECKIDTVEIIPEEVWRGDPARFYLFDDSFGAVGSLLATTIGASAGFGIWSFSTGANAGKYQFSGSFGVNGGLQLSTLNTAAGDYAMATMAMPSVNAAANPSFVEQRVAVAPTLNVNTVVETGWGDGFIAPSQNLAGWVWDGSLGVGSTWRWRSAVATVLTSADSNIAITASTFMRFGVCTATVRGVAGAVFLKDGKALPGAGSIPPYLVAPTSVSVQPWFRVRTVTAGNFATATIDWMRFMLPRP